MTGRWVTREALRAVLTDFDREPTEEYCRATVADERGGVISERSQRTEPCMTCGYYHVPGDAHIPERSIVP